MFLSTLKKNYLYTLLRILSSFVFPFISFPYLLRILGPNKIGQVEYMVSIAQYSSLIAALGISTYGIREIALIRDDPKKLRKVFSELLIIRMINSFIVVVFLCFVLLSIKVDKPLMLITIIYMILQIGIIDWFFQGIEKLKEITWRVILTKLLVVVLIFVFIRRQEDYIWYYLFLTLDSIASLSYGLYFISKNVGFQINNLELKRHIKPMLLMFGVQFSVSVYTILDKIMLGALSSNDEVGYYTTALKIIKIVQTIVTSLGIVLLPRLSYYINNEDSENFGKLISKAYNFIFMIATPLVVGIIITSEDVIHLFAGIQFQKSGLLLKYLAIIILLVSLSNLYGTQILVSIRREKEFTIVVTIGALLNVLLNVLLIPTFKSQGAIVSTIITEFVVVLGCGFYAHRLYKGLPVPNFKQVFKFIFLAGLFIIVDQIIDFDNILMRLIFKITLCIAIYFLGLLLTKDKLLLESMSMIKKAKNEI